MYTKDEIFNKVKHTISETMMVEIDENNITHDSHVIDDLGADSIEVVDIIMELEEVFDEDIEDDDIKELLTVRQIVDFIYNKQDS